MHNKPTLLVIAAGMGSRYGGLKQIDPVGPHGEMIMDYSLYDAVRAGFQKIVFVIRHAFEKAFRERIGRKLDGLAETAYAFQELDMGLDGFDLPKDRRKPWGTGHAILVAGQVIEEPFAVINADDYYGHRAYSMIKEPFIQMSQEPDRNEYVMAGYLLKNTLTAHGTVARGLCRHSPDLYLTEITERTGIRKDGSGAVYTDEKGLEHSLTGDEIVSMNLWGFAPDIFDSLQRQFSDFLKQHGRDNTSEFYLPAAVDTLLKSGLKKVKVIQTNDHWFGMTYRKDKQTAQASIRKLIQQGLYPENLWGKQS